MEYKESEMFSSGKPVTVQFVHSRDTKNAHVYAERNKQGEAITDMRESQMGGLYLRMDAVDGAAPKYLTAIICCAAAGEDPMEAPVPGEDVEPEDEDNG